MNNEPVARVNNEHYCLVWEDAYGKLKVVDTYPPPEGSIKLYTHPVKELTDDEINIVKEAVGNYVCTIKMEIDQQKQTFKGYEHCSNLPSLRSELKDAEQALAILRKAQEK